MKIKKKNGYEKVRLSATYLMKITALFWRRLKKSVNVDFYRRFATWRLYDRPNIRLSMQRHFRLQSVEPLLGFIYQNIE